jgi:hypothetical protein
MKTIAVCALAFLVAGVTYGQFTMHEDGRGYSMRSGNMVIQSRQPGYGTSSTHFRSGNLMFHDYDNGTTGTQIYTDSGRFDSWSNHRQGWQGSGYSPYSNQYGSPYGNPYGGYQRYGRPRY